MDLLKQRLSFAGMWAFEDIGIQELENELIRKYPHLGCHCEYSRAEEVLVVKGKLQGMIAQITAMISSFIEKQKANDLLDTPRLRALEIPVVRNQSSVQGELDGPRNDGLLCLYDDPGTFIPYHRTQVTKFWLAAAGGIGCFAQNAFNEVLGEVARCSGTEIVVVDDFKGIQISGGSENDVDDALAKLNQIEQPMTCLLKPEVHNLTIGQTEHGTAYRIQPYEQLGPLAIRRILADTSSGLDPGAGQMFVTTLYSLNEDTHKYSPPKNLAEPLPCNRENGASRIWNDFTFQGVGKGDDFAALMESPVESSNPETQLVPVEIAKSHPYLSADKAKQVSEWVVDKLGTEAVAVGTSQQPEDVVGPSRQPQTPPPVLPGAGPKKVPGIKKRRPVGQVSRTEAIEDSKETKAESPPAEPAAPPDVRADTPRKKWKMVYQDTSGSPERQSPAKNVEKITSSRSPVLNEPATSTLPTLETSSGLKFDPSGYGLSKPSPQKAKPGIGVLKPKKLGRSPPLAKTKPASKPPARSSWKEHELVDLLTPVDTIASTQPRLGINATPLVPNKPAPPVISQNCSDLAGLQMDEAVDPDKSTTASSSCKRETASDPATRLQNLKQDFEKRQASTLSKAGTNLSKRHGSYNRFKQLSEAAVCDSERNNKSEAEESGNEIMSRRHHNTMRQRSAKPDLKAKSKSAAQAREQATLEDAWGKPKSKKPAESLLVQNASPNLPTSETNQSAKPKEPEAPADEDVRRLLTATRLILEAAESFPGMLTFEIQFGLVVIPLLPRTCNVDLMSSNEWSKLFQSRTGVAAPTTKFVDRLTTCGSEVDHVVDLKFSKAEGKGRMFEETYSEYSIIYEFHCRRANESFIIAIDEKGQYSVQHPKSPLGAVNMHFPSKVWDARALVGTAFQFRSDTRPGLEETAQYIADHLWIPAEKNICIYTSVPKGSKVTIDKVFMKRWTRHRCLRPDAAAQENTTAGEQDIFLQVTEVQDLIIGLVARESSEKQRIRARFTTPEEMIHLGKVWYELSLVSTAIETILKTNTTLEVGERTEDWRGADLCEDISLGAINKAPGSPRSSVTSAAGAGSLAEMLKVAKTVVKKIDGVGTCNRGPLGLDMTVAVANMAQATKSLEHDEIESVKEVQSVIARVDDPPFDAEAFKREELEKEFW